ncbi:hypothetical protein DFP73DRAFT_276910 [Morchella snyderi]|nr:hypothetical protein DFP73DRAFT_276910 [Morchella snyderi]
MGHSVGRSFRSFLHCTLFTLLHFGYGFFFYLEVSAGFFTCPFSFFLSFPFVLYRGFEFSFLSKADTTKVLQDSQSLAFYGLCFPYIYCTKSNEQIRKEIKDFVRSARGLRRVQSASQREEKNFRPNPEGSSFYYM